MAYRLPSLNSSLLFETEHWEVWSDLAGMPLSRPSRGPRFDTIHMAIEAVAEGLGVAIGRLPLIDTDIAAGRLVPMLGPPVKCAMGYRLVAGEGSLRRPEVAALRDQIRGELGGKAAAARAMQTIAVDKHALAAHR